MPTLYTALLPSPAFDRAPRAALNAPSRCAPATGASRKLLVVDDEESIRDVLRQYFEFHKYQIKAVATGEEAISSLEQDKFDLAIVDLVMPGMDGLDLLEIIRNEHPRLPVVIFTGVGFDNEILLEAREKGASGFLSKGLPLAQLLMEVHRLLNYRE